MISIEKAAQYKSTKWRILVVNAAQQHFALGLQLELAKTAETS